jgi:hypothetical protein
MSVSHELLTQLRVDLLAACDELRWLCSRLSSGTVCTVSLRACQSLAINHQDATMLSTHNMLQTGRHLRLL